ncbi:immunity protein YezG family protein [Bacillus sp. FJAT-28004]|uniref:immunity protein YezG family protein n=1 Tax=Bacillus sp. FJAT-28004 TaxID=1679165 RepID=UPI0006B4C2A2|nr:immunity protein YezG family protein [Bacillus sp. FJAT-28004]
MKKTEELYQLIGNNLVGIIPDEWDKIYLYAEILPDSRIVYFYYKSTKKNSLIHCHNIPDVYGVDSRIYDQLFIELEENFVNLNAESCKNSLQPWTNLTMFLDQSGKFNVDYNYDEILLSPNRQRTIWKYEVLGIYPTDEFQRETVDEYLKQKTD